VGKAEEPDDSSYLKWRVDEMSPRTRWVTEALFAAGTAALMLPHYFTTNQAIAIGFDFAGLALAM
jgi:hypothetical protein